MELHQKNSVLSRTPVVCALALVCCLLWGSAFPCIKIGYELFQIPSGAIPSQLLFAGYRFCLAGLLAICIGSLIKRQLLLPHKESLFPIVKLGMIQTVLQYVLFYIGLAHTTGVKASIIEASNVFFSILLASLFRYETLRFRKLLGCIVGFSGVVLINLTGSGLDSPVSFWGEGALLLSAAAYALSSTLVKRYGQKEDAIVLSGYQFLFGGCIMTALGFFLGGTVTGFTPSSFGLLLYLSLISAVAYSLWALLLQHNPVGKVAVFGFMNPVFGVLLSALLLHEKSQAFGLQGLLALFLVCAGIYIVNRNPE